jgi:hypothetical protein
LDGGSVGALDGVSDGRSVEESMRSLGVVVRNDPNGTGDGVELSASELVSTGTFASEPRSTTAHITRIRQSKMKQDIIAILIRRRCCLLL